MKAITFLLFIGLMFFNNSINAQSKTSIENLLERLDENHMGSVSDVFTNEELETLQNYFYEKNAINENPAFLLNRRISTTQAVTVVTAADINPVDLSSIEDFIPSPLNEFEGAGVVRMNPINGAYIVDNANTVWLRGIGTVNYSKVGTLNNVPTGESVTGLEYTSTGALYGVSTNGTNSSTLLQINTTTWDATLIGNPNIILPINLGRDANDNLYTVGIDGDKFFRVNITTGIETELGDIGYDANFGQGMTYDPFTDKLLITAFNNDLFDSELREININTGFSTSLGTIVPGTLMQFGWGSMYDKDVLGNEETIFKDFSFYPNPANDIIILKSPYNIETVEIFSIIGQKVITKTVGATSSNINISELPTGHYLMRIVSNNETGVYKLLKL